MFIVTCGECKFLAEWGSIGRLAASVSSLRAGHEIEFVPWITTNKPQLYRKKQCSGMWINSGSHPTGHPRALFPSPSFLACAHGHLSFPLSRGTSLLQLERSQNSIKANEYEVSPSSPSLAVWGGGGYGVRSAGVIARTRGRDGGSVHILAGVACGDIVWTKGSAHTYRKGD